MAGVAENAAIVLCINTNTVLNGDAELQIWVPTQDIPQHVMHVHVGQDSSFNATISEISRQKIQTSTDFSKAFVEVTI